MNRAQCLYNRRGSIESWNDYRCAHAIFRTNYFWSIIQGLIPSPIDQSPCAHSRDPIDIIRGWSTSYQSKKAPPKIDPLQMQHNIHGLLYSN